MDSLGPWSLTLKCLYSTQGYTENQTASLRIFVAMAGKHRRLRFRLCAPLKRQLKPDCRSFIAVRCHLKSSADAFGALAHTRQPVTFTVLRGIESFSIVADP